MSSHNARSTYGPHFGKFQFSDWCLVSVDEAVPALSEALSQGALGSSIDTAGRTAPARPTIVVSHAEGASHEFPHNSAVSHSSDEDSSRGSLDLEDPTNNVKNPSDDLIPSSSITCSLHITFGQDPASDPAIGLTVCLTDPDSYSRIETVSQNHVTDTFKEDLDRRELVFRYGNCTITGQNVEKCGLPLTSRDDWNSTCIVISNYLTSKPNRHLHLDIFRNYFAFRFRASSDVSFAGAKRAEIHTLMKRASDGRQYLPRTDFLQVTSKETIRDVIVQDPQLDMALDEKDKFIEKVQRKAPKLIAMCVFAGLKMECLKKLLDIGYSDESLPLERKHCCHQKCAVDFEILVEKQGGFSAAEFWIVGEHQKLHPSTVVPVHFHPRDKDEDGALDKAGPHESDEPEDSYGGAGESDSAKRNAWCGSGAYSNVVSLSCSSHLLYDQL